MVTRCFAIVYTIACLFCLKCIRANETRRLQHGALLSTFYKPFMVYITKSREQDDGWICAGAIVKPDTILTAAACVEQNIPLYVIAGKKTYNPPSEWDKIQCILAKKRKIVKICRPKEYEYDPNLFTKWSNWDIALAKVDKPYDFNDLTWRLHCDYVPQPIRINYSHKYEELNRYCYMYGWGHKYGYNRPGDIINYNQHVMHYVNAKIVTRASCKRKVLDMQGQVNLSNKICAGSRHSLDPDFNPMYVEDYKPMLVDQCGSRSRKSNSNNTNCSNVTHSDEDFSDDDFSGEDFNFTDIDARKNGKKPQHNGGLCQNDHGTPLTTYVGSEEIVIGVGIAPNVDSVFKCHSPSLFTSTYCMSLFLRCVFNEPPLLLTRKMCQAYTKKEGFYIEEIDRNF